MTNFKADDLKKSRQLAIKFAFSFSTMDKETAEDFAQEYCTAIWLGETKNLRWQFANYFRKYLGETGKKIVWQMPSEEEKYDPNLRLQLLEMRSYIKQIKDHRTRMVMTLIVHDLPQKLIAEIYQCDPSFISQIYKEGLKELKRMYKTDKF